MLRMIAVVLALLWMLGLETGFSIGSFIPILIASVVALLVISLSREVMINQKLRNVLRNCDPKPDRRKKGLQPIFLPPTYKKE